MNNIAPRRIVSRRANQLYTLAFLIGALGIFLIALGLAMAVLQLDKPGTSTYWFYALVEGALIGLGAVGVVVAIVLAIRGVSYRRDNDLASLTAQVLAPMLNNRFTFIRSLNKRSIGYVDAILAGPPGLLVFRLVDATGAYFNDGPNWMKRDPNGVWKPAGFNPTREDQADIAKLREYLARRGFSDIPLTGIIVFTEDPQRVALQSKDGPLPITHLAYLAGALGSLYLSAPPLDDARIEAAVQALLA